MPSATRAQPAPPFASRELNGEVLLEELSDLRGAHVQQRTLNDAVQGLSELGTARVTEAITRIKQLAAGRFAGQPAMAELLVRWAARLKTEVDVPLLVAHFERLAMTAAALHALRKAADRLPQGGRG